ncbi:MAG: response regulator [Rhodoferax sp.]|uniref:ATP-binding response regulator n=1 Tax=Rhodoferax sp. TaxID=50421 RepID=UPI00262799D1|nr:response regulator [Rhodoferax sp.]MDD2881864.1 response regulator [Rhodoferax sp.]
MSDPQAQLARLEDVLRRITLLGHDMRAPLNHILGYTRLMQRDAHPLVEDERLAIVERSGVTLLGVIDEVLSLCRCDAAPQPQSLPAPAAEVPARAVEATRTPEPAGHRYRALVVDDDADTRRLLEVMCSQWGLWVELAQSGAQALVVCKRAQAGFDVVLVDQHMPGMTGWDFLQALRQEVGLRRLPVILVSGSAVRPAGLPDSLDFDAVLMKPFNQASLSCMLQLVLGASDTAGPTQTALLRPPEEKLAVFRQALAWGDVLAVQRWARDLASAETGFTHFAAEVDLACRRVDLKGLAALAGLPPDAFG